MQALRRGDGAHDPDDLITVLTDDDEAGGSRRIRCPRCGWTPGPGERWMCVCSCLWDTFETGGRCPDCGRRWHQTQCKLCGEWSPHEDWYADEPGPRTR